MRGDTYVAAIQALGFRHPGLQKVTRPHVNAASRRLSTRPGDLTQVLVVPVLIALHVLLSMVLEVFI